MRQQSVISVSRRLTVVTLSAGLFARAAHEEGVAVVTVARAVPVGAQVVEVLAPLCNQCNGKTRTCG